MCSSDQRSMCAGLLASYLCFQYIRFFLFISVFSLNFARRFSYQLIVHASCYCSRVAQTATDFADASHSKSAKSVIITVLYGIFSSENAYPCTVTKNEQIWLTIQNAFDNIYQVNSISHGGVVSTNVWFVNILIIGKYIIWQILNNETHVYRWTVNVWMHCWQLIYMGLCYLSENFAGIP